MAKAYDVPATWAPRLHGMAAATVPGGHFFIDQAPQQTESILRAFLSGELPVVQE